MSDEIHDFSRLDAFMAARRRAMVLHSAWRPMLAGAIGASLIIAAVWVATPKFTVREVVVDRVVPRDVPFENFVPHDKPFDNFVPVPHNVPGPVAANPPSPPPDPPKTPAERKFEGSSEYRDAPYHGRIIKSVDGKALSFADNTNLLPAHWDAKTSQSVYDTDEAFDSDALIGLLAACVLDEHALWHCSAMAERSPFNSNKKPCTSRRRPSTSDRS